MPIITNSTIDFPRGRKKIEFSLSLGCSGGKSEYASEDSSITRESESAIQPPTRIRRYGKSLKTCFGRAMPWAHGTLRKLQSFYFFAKRYKLEKFFRNKQIPFNKTVIKYIKYSWMPIDWLVKWECRILYDTINFK